MPTASRHTRLFAFLKCLTCVLPVMEEWPFNKLSQFFVPFSRFLPSGAAVARALAPTAACAQTIDIASVDKIEKLFNSLVSRSADLTVS